MDGKERGSIGGGGIKGHRDGERENDQNKKMAPNLFFLKHRKLSAYVAFVNMDIDIKL
jgi:hypothetical protein